MTYAELRAMAKLDHGVRGPKHRELLDPWDPICGGCEREADAALESCDAARAERDAMEQR
jgi:hypothetical protein